MTPQVAVFDLGNVLVSFDWGLGARRLAAQSQVAAADLPRLFGGATSLVEYELGHLTTAEFFAAARQLIGFRGTLADFDAAFSDIFQEIPPMVDLHGALRSRGVPTYVFSNTNELHCAHIRRRFPFFHRFDGYILSYQCGSMKPDARIYEILEQRTGRRGTEIVFLDDRAENVAAAAARGWQAFHHTAPEASRAFLKQTGLLG